MGETSSRVKQKWNAAHYKQVAAQLDKDLVEQWERKLAASGIGKAEFIRNAITKFLETEE